MDQVEAAAYHEAGHVLALRHIGRRALSVSVNEDGSGVTVPDVLPDDDEAIALVGLAGIQAESQRSDVEFELHDFIKAYTGAASDRNLIAQAFDGVWLAHTSTSRWYQAQYNRAHKLVQQYEQDIVSLARAILAVKGYPKRLEEDEIDRALSN